MQRANTKQTISQYACELVLKEFGSVTLSSTAI